MEISDYQPEKAEVRPIDVVSDAVMAAYWKELKSEISYQVLDPDKPSFPGGFKRLSGEATRAQCNSASIDTVSFITKRHPELFKKLAVISTDVVSKDSWLNKLSKPLKRHSYFIAEGVDGYWYAGSPANSYIAKRRPWYAFEVIRDDTLGKVLRKIERRDRAQFPTSERILDILEDPNEFPQITKFGDDNSTYETITIPEIKQTFTGYSHTSEDYFLRFT